MTKTFDLLLFSIDPDYIVEAVSAGVDAIIVDWEQRGKHERQTQLDTQINQHTVEDLKRVRAVTAARVICRINGVYDATHTEIEQALDAGADELFVPMVRTVAEVEQVLCQVNGRSGVNVLIETNEALHIVSELALLPLNRVYVGLNDLAIQRGLNNIFASIADQTVERVRIAFTSGKFGFGGLTLPERGSPIPSHLLMAELARLDCDFTFLRRSFTRDLPPGTLAAGVPRLREALLAKWQRSADATLAEQAALYSLIRERPHGPEVLA